MNTAYRNDALHPTLGRALPIAQTTLDRDPNDAGAANRSAYGTCDVLESTGAGGLTDFTFGATQTGVSWSLNPYAGCAHACTYCYVPDTIKAERWRWGSYSIVKRDLPKRLAHAMKRSKRMTVYLSTSTDPYQPLEAEHEITRKCLEVLVRKDWPVEILTRSPLVLRDLDLIRQLSEVRVGFSVPTFDDGLRRLLEPKAPPIQARLDALRQVADEGITTWANYTPAAPPTTHTADDIANAFLAAGAQWVNSRALQRRETAMVPVYEALLGSTYEDVARFWCSTPRQAAWQQELGNAFRKVGLPLSTPFFNPPFAELAPTTRGTQSRLDEIRLPLLTIPARKPKPREAVALPLR